MRLPKNKVVWSSGLGLIVLALLLVVFGWIPGTAQARALHQTTTKPMTDTMPMDHAAMGHNMAMSETMTMPVDSQAMDHTAHLMARIDALEARLAAIEEKLGNQAQSGSMMGGQDGMMGGMMGQGHQNQSGNMMGQEGMMGQGGMMQGGMMGRMADMHAQMAEMHAQMAMMATMSAMHGMMGDMMGQGGMMGEGGMMGQGAQPAMPNGGAQGGPATNAPVADNAQSAKLGTIDVKVTPVDLANRAGDTLAFTVDLNSADGGLNFDLAKLALIEAGMEVEATGWEVAFDHGHHVNGTLTFPLTHGGGHRYLDGADAVTVVIHAPAGEEQVTFTWPLE